MLLGKKLGPFAIEKELGSGAMGVVYKALYTETGQYVAIKVILQGLSGNKNMLARFDREIEVLKQLRHPNIVRLYASGRYKGNPFYAMEFLEGDTLDKVLRKRERIPWQEVAQLGKQLCSALQHAHEKEIIHRDLKPGNLMILPNGTLKLTDFGIAKDLDLTQLTATNATVGTASYMSPEQCQGVKFLTNKSDLYSLGVVFYELLTGRTPFQAETLMDMFLQHVKGEFAPPGRVLLEIPGWFDAIVCQLLAKSPDARPNDAREVAKMIDQVEKGIVRPPAPAPAPSASVFDDLSLSETKSKKRKGTTSRGSGGKKSAGAIHEKVWFQATGISVVLVGLGLLIYAGLRGPDPDKLFREAQALMESKNPDDWNAARDGPIKSYLEKKKEATDEQARQVRAWADKVDLTLKERQLLNRFGRISQPEGDEEPVAWSALRKEHDGADWAVSQGVWKNLLRWRDSTDAEKRPWGLLAEKRIGLLQDAQTRYDRINGIITVAQAGDGKIKADDDMDENVIEAMRQEAAGKKAAARESWKKVRDTYEKNRDQYLWVLIASRKMKDLPVKE